MVGTLDILERLIGFNSISANSNLAIIEYIEAFLQERGFRISRLKDPKGQKAGLFAEIGPVDGGIILSAHTDVVPVDGQDWTREPFRLTREADRLYGRGTTDMKSYLACMLRAADQAALRTLKEPLKLVFSYDEEIGCVGIQLMKNQLAPLLGNPRLCIVGEPTEMNVAIGHKGKAAIRAICNGQNGHSAMAPLYVNALHLAADFITELRHIQTILIAQGAYDAAYDIPYTTIHSGKLTAGTALNIVPDHAELIFEYRHLAADTPDWVMGLIQDAVLRVSAPYHKMFPKAAITLDRYNAYPGLDMLANAPPVLHAQKLAMTPKTIKVAFGTEAGVFHELGIDTIVCGPGSMAGQGHKPDEFITAGQIAACERMMDRILDDLAA